MVPALARWLLRGAIGGDPHRFGSRAVELRGRSLAEDPCWHSSDHESSSFEGARHYGVCGDVASVADADGTEDPSARGDIDSIAERRGSLGGTTESHALVDGAVLTDLCTMRDDHPGRMRQAETGSDPCFEPDVRSGQNVRDLLDERCDRGRTMVDSMCEPNTEDGERLDRGNRAGDETDLTQTAGRNRASVRPRKVAAGEPPRLAARRSGDSSW